MRTHNELFEEFVPVGCYYWMKYLSLLKKIQDEPIFVKFSKPHSSKHAGNQKKSMNREDVCKTNLAVLITMRPSL